MDSSNSLSRRRFVQRIILGSAAASLSLPVVVRAAERNPKINHIMKRSDKTFIPVMLTVYHENGKIDYKGMDRLMDYYLASGAKGFFANCLSSEMYHLSDEEKLELTRYVVKHVNGKIPVVATGSFGDTIQSKAVFTKRMADTGVDAVILITAHFAEKDEPDTTFIQNIEQFLRLTGNIPLGTYECPNPYKRIIHPEAMKFLVGEDRFVYHKDTTEDIDQIKTKIDLGKGGKLGLYNAHIGSAAASLQYGGKGLSPIAGNFYPEIIAWMCDNAANPDRKEDVDWLQEKLIVAESKIGRQYQLGARYFLSKRGLVMPVFSRGTKGKLSAEQATVLDELLEELKSWHERLGIV